MLAWHQQKTKIITWLEQKVTGMPSVLLRAYAEMIYCEVCDSSSVGLPRLFEIPPLEFVPDERRPSMFDGVKLVRQPKQLPGSATPHDLNPFTVGMSARMTKMMPQVVERRRLQTAKLVREKKPTILGTEPAADAYPWNGAGIDALPAFFCGCNQLRRGHHYKARHVWGPSFGVEPDPRP